jgi:hypothetical protein
MTTPTISITDLISNTLSGEGNGVFDVLINKVNKELEHQFVKGYLKGAEYAQVYVGSLNSVLGQSMQFLLSKDKLNIELQLLELQKEAQKTTNEKLKLEKEILVVQKEVIEIQKIEAGIRNELLNLEKITVGKQQNLLDKQVLVEDQKRLNMAQELLQITAQKDLILQQKLNLVTEGLKLDQEVGLVENNKLIAAQQIDVMTQTKIKTISEINLLNAKVTTEAKQLPMMDKQIELYEAQRVGFGQDAQTKTFKIKADAWAVARSTDPDATPLPPSLTP